MRVINKNILRWLFFMIPLSIAFVIIAIKPFKEETSEIIDNKTEVDIKVEFLSINRGMIFLNDSLLIFGDCKLIQEKDKSYPSYIKEYSPPIFRPENKNFKPALIDVTAPYQLKKESENDTLIVIKNNDTLYFQYVDPNTDEYNLKDPSFKDVWEYFF